MISPEAIRFDQAWAVAKSFIGERLSSIPSEALVLVRDLYGRIRIALDDQAPSPGIPGPAERKALAEELSPRLGAFSPGPSSIFLVASEMFLPHEVFATSDALWVGPRDRRYRILDRSVIGADWLREPLAAPETPRLTLYGVKGGVGRSTATAILAWRWSQAGKRVLVLDLDLESPGVGSTLLPEERSPDFGLIDWFVEEAVGQADERLLNELVVSSPLGAGGADLLVAPAGGRSRPGYSYLPKLARAYAEIPSQENPPLAFGERLSHLIQSLEEKYQPDVTLLDSRAGMHDIAATAITRLGETSLLFAVDTVQTWQAYRSLFEAWREHFDRAAAFREGLKMVAAQVPETETVAYLDGFRQHSYDLFAENLYVETPPGEQSDFNFDPADPEAPHTPLRIHWSRTFQQFDPVQHPEAVTEEQVRAAFGDFVRGTGLLVFGEDLGWP